MYILKPTQIFNKITFLLPLSLVLITTILLSSPSSQPFANAADDDTPAAAAATTPKTTPMLPPPIPSHELNITTRTDVYSTWSVNTEKFGLDDLLDYFGQLSTINKNLNSGVLKMLSDNWETLAGIIGEAFSDINDGYPQIYDSMTKQLGNTEVPKTYDPEWIAKLGDLDPVVKKAFGIDELISGLDEYTSVFDEIRNEIDYENRINAGGSATKSGEEESSRKSNDHDDDEGRGTNSRGIINNTLFVSLAFAVIVCTMLF